MLFGQVGVDEKMDYEKISKKTPYILIVCLVIGIIAMGLITRMELNQVNQKNIEFREEIQELKKIINTIGIDFQELNNNQVILGENQKIISALAKHINCKQMLSEGFFDSMIIELILENELQTSGDALIQKEIDYNKLREIGCWTQGVN